MVTQTVEERAAVLLRRLLARRSTTPAAVARALEVEPAAVERLTSGGGVLELSRLEKVLGVLGVSPQQFFAELYGPEPLVDEVAATAPEDAAVDRKEVEVLLAELRSMIHGMVRLLDAEEAVAQGGSDGEAGHC
jgi:transcriptional regulator with XRE-family HTH domain